MADEKVQSIEKPDKEKKDMKKEIPKEERGAVVTGERVITVNLRKELVGNPYWRRTKDAVSILRRILEKKTKTDKIVIGNKLNERLWSRGMQRPDVKLRVKIIKDGDVTRAELME